MIRPLLFDTSVLIPLINSGRYEFVFRKALRSGRARLCSVVLQELLAGTPDAEGKKALDAMNSAFLRANAVVTPRHEDWHTAGVILARYMRLYGQVEPGDHLSDLLIALCAAQAGAVLVTENEKDMKRWAASIRRQGRTLTVTTPEQLA